MVRCFKKNASAGSNTMHRDIFSKSLHGSEAESMRSWLGRYPNRVKEVFLIKGFEEGFPLPPFKGKGCKVVGNLKSVSSFTQVVREKVFKEISEGCVEGLFRDPPFQDFRISPLRVVPKREPNAFRLIHHLFFPKGS